MSSFNVGDIVSFKTIDGCVYCTPHHVGVIVEKHIRKFDGEVEKKGSTFYYIKDVNSQHYYDYKVEERNIVCKREKI